MCYFEDYSDNSLHAGCYTKDEVMNTLDLMNTPKSSWNKTEGQ